MAKKEQLIEEEFEGEVDTWKGQGSFDDELPDWLGSGINGASIPTPDEEEILRVQGEADRAALAAQGRLPEPAIPVIQSVTETEEE